MNNNNDITLFWFRRDLRLEDNAGLYHALKQHDNVLPLFIFDADILDKLEHKQDARVEFIHREVAALKEQLLKNGSDMLVLYGSPLQVFKDILTQYQVHAVYTNRDYEPYAIARDKAVADLLRSHNVELITRKDQYIFEPGEVLKDDGTPYTVFTPYSKKWKAKLNDFYLRSYPSLQYLPSLKKIAAQAMPSLQDIGFKPAGIQFPSKEIASGIIKHYSETRDIPSVAGTSRLSLHFRFGTVSVREKMRRAIALSEKWVNELIWREFYMQILYYFPHVTNHAFKPEYDRIIWRNNPVEFDAWRSGNTGYPIVDAGMRELKNTGYMHNRVRMIVASFLTKHLLIDWRWGEAWFAEKLLDFELASNNGGWQWAAGCGVDAAPYFRVFNPQLQTEKFDPQYRYIRQWVPEFGTPSYAKPIVEHTFARNRCLEVYKTALSKY